VTATLAEVRAAAREGRAAWSPLATLATAGFAVAALAPLVLSTSRLDELASGLCLAMAATALGLVVGVGGLPSLAQGAFMAVGAFTAAQLRVHGGFPTLAAALVGAVAAGAAGALVGAGLLRLGRGLYAVATWLVAWLVAFALLAFPSISGGVQGTVLPEGPSTSTLYEVALLLTALVVLASVALARSPFGHVLAAARVRRPAASALGLPFDRARLAAVVASAALAGLAGGVAVQIAGVADAASYGPFLSFKLFAIVVIGGALAPLGPLAGTIVLGILASVADAVASLEGVSGARFQPFFTAILLLAVLALGGDGLLRRPKLTRPGGKRPLDPPPRGGRISGRGLTRRYGGVVALNGLDLDAGAGEIVALVGPNGSGKTTALRLLGRTETPDAGTIAVEGGAVRTLQGDPVFPELTALEHVVAGTSPRLRRSGLVRAALATPKARAERRRAEAEAAAALELVGLGRHAGTEARELTTSERRLLALATAYATGASVLLVDELSAGASPADLERIAEVLATVRERGVAVVVVEHNLRLVRAVADRVVVLDGGEVLVSGTPDDVGADPRVRDAYLGRQAL